MSFGFECSLPNFLLGTKSINNTVLDAFMDEQRIIPSTFLLELYCIMRRGLIHLRNWIKQALFHQEPRE